MKVETKRLRELGRKVVELQLSNHDSKRFSIELKKLLKESSK